MLKSIDRKAISKAILKSQHCQRNFDLSQTISDEDLELLKTAVTQCPSKQNVAFYKAHFVFDRKLIEAIHSSTDGFGLQDKEGKFFKKSQTNSQTLANLLVLFESIDVVNEDKHHESRNTETKKLVEGQADSATLEILRKDRDQCVGVAAGYLNLTASLLGYATGCCSCFDEQKVQKIVGAKGKILLIMGIGFKDTSRNRREHHLDKNFIFPSFKKQAISLHLLGRQEGVKQIS